MDSLDIQGLDYSHTSSRLVRQVEMSDPDDPNDWDAPR